MLVILMDCKSEIELRLEIIIHITVIVIHAMHIKIKHFEIVKIEI